MYGERFEKIYRADFEIFEKALKMENCPKLYNAIVGVIWRKTLVLRIAKKEVDKTFMTSNIALSYILGRDYFEAILSAISRCTLLCLRQLRNVPSCPK